MNPANIQTPTSPLGSFPELSAMYRSSFQLPFSAAQAGAQSYNDQVSIANQKANESANAAKNYQSVARQDGGFGFYDPSGKEITAAQYASVTGKSPSDVLKHSINPIDIGYQKDFKDLQDYMNLKFQSKADKGAATKASAIEQDVKKTLGVDIAKLKPEELIQAFQAAYPTVYGQGGFNGPNSAGVKSGSLFIPQATNSLVKSYTSGDSGGRFSL